jgi:hypothetical protein
MTEAPVRAEPAERLILRERRPFDRSEIAHGGDLIAAANIVAADDVKQYAPSTIDRNF